jgi:small subunit ribosomal protein S20
MPITKSAIKAARQNAARRERRQPFNTKMKTMIRSLTDLAKQGKTDNARTLLPAVYKAIDAAAKKHIIHPNTASRKKSLMARMVAKK